MKKTTHRLRTFYSPRVLLPPDGASHSVRVTYHLLRSVWDGAFRPLRQLHFARVTGQHSTVVRSEADSTDLTKPRAVLLCVYRNVNGPVVSHLLRSAGDLGLEIRLWALDEVHPALSDHTLGVGPGGKYELLNRLRDIGPTDQRSWWIIADDDVLLSGGASLRALLDIMSAADLDVAQPAHSWWSAATYWLTYRRPWATARSTAFVEIGPLLAISPKAVSLILPFPPHAGMGWSIQADWFVLARDQLRFGIIDGVGMIHRDLPAQGYDWMAEHLRFLDELQHLEVAPEDYLASLSFSRPLLPRRARWSQERSGPLF